MAADLTDLFQALYKRYAKFRGPTDAYTLTDGRFHRTLAPAGQTFPYIVVTQIGGAILEMFSGDALEDASFQTSVFAEFRNDASAASAIIQSLIGIFNWSTLHIPAHETFIRMRREGLQREVVEDQDIIHISQDWFVEREIQAWT